MCCRQDEGPRHSPVPAHDEHHGTWTETTVSNRHRIDRNSHTDKVKQGGGYTHKGRIGAPMKRRSENYKTS